MASVWTGNFGRHVSTKQFLANVRALDDELGRGAVVKLQEIDEDDEPDEHSGFDRALEGFTWAGWETHEPIAFGPNWTLEDEDVIFGTKGVPRLSPARPIVEARARHKSGLAVVFLNMHYPRNVPELHDEWRQLRRKHVERLDHHFDRHDSVIWSADVNRASFSLLHQFEREVAHRKLDWIRCVEHPRGTELELGKRLSVDLDIDGHDAIGRTLTLHEAD